VPTFAAQIVYSIELFCWFIDVTVAKLFALTHLISNQNIHPYWCKHYVLGSGVDDANQ
jgi:hypothetical protein